MSETPFTMLPENVERLARYNAECARGIVHTKEYDKRMATLQAQWNAEHQPSSLWESVISEAMR